MVHFELVTQIQASPEVCFDLSRDMDMHERSMGHTNEVAIAGVTTGLIGMGEEVTFRGRHFGTWHTHRSRITAFDRPRHFRDEMVSGRFASFVHDHYFEATDAGTCMRDVVELRSPLGPLGALVDALLLKGYMRRLLESRNRMLCIEAHSAEVQDRHPK